MHPAVCSTTGVVPHLITAPARGPAGPAGGGHDFSFFRLPAAKTCAIAGSWKPAAP
eukprot:SAG31_NODE_34318_length_334_cov_0.868085_1_plen_55_part_10